MNKETWHIQIVDSIEAFKKNINYVSEGFEFKNIIQFAKNKGYDETNISAKQLVKKFLQQETLDLKSEHIDKQLFDLIEEIESLGLYASVIYKYNKGLALKITYIKLFGPDVSYFLEKAKKVFFPGSLEVQQLFGTRDVKLYEMWVPEYKKWVKEANRTYLKDLFKKKTIELINEIEKIG